MVAGSHRFFSLPTAGFVNFSDGYTSEYYCRGEGDPIVLVPGLAGGTGLLRPLIDALTTDHRVYSFELRGEKSCVCDRKFQFDRLVRDLAEFTEQLGLERPGVFGLSFGGAIAAELACRMPSRFAYLAIQGAGYTHHYRLVDDVARRLLDRMLLPGSSPLVAQFFRLLTGEGSREEYGLDFVIDQSWSTDQSVMAHRFSMLAEYDIMDRLSSLSLPVLLLSGEHDVLAQPADMEVFANSLPEADLRTIAHGGHFAFVTHAGQLADELRDFRHGVLSRR